jgi:hypothetical protein
VTIISTTNVVRIADERGERLTRLAVAPRAKAGG